MVKMLKPHMERISFFLLISLLTIVCLMCAVRVCVFGIEFIHQTTAFAATMKVSSACSRCNDWHTNVNLKPTCNMEMLYPRYHLLGRCSYQQQIQCYDTYNEKKKKKMVRKSNMDFKHSKRAHRRHFFI